MVVYGNMSLYVYDISPYFEIGTEQNFISFRSKFAEYNFNVNVFSVHAKACSCDLSLSSFEDEKI